MAVFIRILGLILLGNILVFKSYQWDNRMYFWLDAAGVTLWLWNEFSLSKKGNSGKDNA